MRDVSIDELGGNEKKLEGEDSKIKENNIPEKKKPNSRLEAMKPRQNEDIKKNGPSSTAIGTRLTGLNEVPSRKKEMTQEKLIELKKKQVLLIE